MHFTQRLFDIACAGLVASAMVCETRRQKNGSVDRPDHLKRRNLPRGPRQTVAAVRAMLGKQETILPQLLQYLRKQRQRNLVRIRDLFRTGAGLLHS